jgi:hypothetical protein
MAGALWQRYKHCGAAFVLAHNRVRSNGPGMGQKPCKMGIDLP